MEKSYLRYKDEFKKHCLFRIIGCGVAVLTLLLLLFLPLFSYKKEGVVLLRFSLFDEAWYLLSRLVKGFNEGNDWWYIVVVWGIVHLVGVAVIIAGIVKFTVDGIKCAFSLSKTEDYALEEYDKIKFRQDSQKKRWGWGWNAWTYGPYGLFYSALYTEVLYILFAKVFGVGYFSVMNSISKVGFVFVLILAVGTIVITSWGNHIHKKIKTAVIKEEYERAAQPPQIEPVFEETAQGEEGK